MSAAMLTATIRLGVALSALAAVVAVALSLVGDVSQWSLAVTVAIAGFALSWIQTGRLDRGEPPIVAWVALGRHAGRRLS